MPIYLQCQLVSVARPSPVAELLNKPTLSGCLLPTVTTGASETAVNKLLIETITKTAAEYEPPMAHKILRVYAAVAKAYSVRINLPWLPHFQVLYYFRL